MQSFKIYLKRDKLIETILFIPEDNTRKYALRFILEKELRSIHKKLKRMQKRGLINNISLPRKDIANDLVKTRNSILKILEQFRKV